MVTSKQTDASQPRRIKTEYNVHDHRRSRKMHLTDDIKRKASESEKGMKNDYVETPSHHPHNHASNLLGSLCALLGSLGWEKFRQDVGEDTTLRDDD